MTTFKCQWVSGVARKSVCLVLSFSGFVLCIGGLSSVPAQAAEVGKARVFDPALSLRGACGTSEADPIPDPGCPGGVHPPKPFFNPCGTVTDSYGDIYVASSAPGSEKPQEEKPNEGRIDIFNAGGEFLGEIKDQFQPCDLAVDSQGNLYVLEHGAHEVEPGQLADRVLLFAPASYPPRAGTGYSTESEAVVVYESSRNSPEAIAVDPSNDHLYVNENRAGIAEFDSAANAPPSGEWTPLREGIGEGIENVVLGTGFDVYGKNHYVYVAGNDGSEPNHADRPELQRVYVINPETNEKVCEAKETPSGYFSFVFGQAAVTVDQSDGDFYLDDTKVNKDVDRFDAQCEYLGRLPTSTPLEKDQGPELQRPDLRPGLAVDAPCIGEGGASCDLGGYHSPAENLNNVYVGSGQDENQSHLFAFALREPGAPEVEAQKAVQIGESEARLEAKVNPHAVKTHYHFQYISQADFEADGGVYGAGAVNAPVPDQQAGEGSSPLVVSQRIGGLQPSTTYRFRVVADNCGQPLSQPQCLTLGEGNPGGEGADATFSTYLPQAPGLPDDRGYELVTPPETGGYFPTSNEMGFEFVNSSTAFSTDFAGPGGDSLLFGIEGGSLAGFPGGGFHDTYEAHRETVDERYGRWQTQFNGVTGREAKEPTPGAFSADHGTSFWSVFKSTSPPEGTYIRRAGGSLMPQCTPDPEIRLEFIGCGTLGTDHYASGEWISPGGGHIIFGTQNNVYEDAPRLEPLSPPTGTSAIYDRTPDGVTHVVSVKPDGGSFGETENAHYQGSSNDGTAVAFAVGGTLYVRLDNAQTATVAEGGPAFGGLSAHGERVFYLRPNSSEPKFEGTNIPQGEIFACEVRSGSCAGSQKTQDAMQVGSGEESVLVNVSADGSHVYFVSPLKLDGSNGIAGQENLYVWSAETEAVRFIATLTPADVIGRQSHVSFRVGGLGLWIPYAVGAHPGPWNGPASDPSRSAPDGSAFVFESRAQLTGYESAGHSEVYRYAASGDLTCLSCSPTGVPASSDAQLQSDSPPQFVSLPPVNEVSSIANVTANGRRVFFQSTERLVLGDTDGKTDVYEWEADGEGSCEAADGCLRLISSGHSGSDDYLYAMSTDGRDVFFETGDRLTPRDLEATPSIYDARVGGGEAPVVAAAAECLGEACQPAVVPPEAKTRASSTFEGLGNLRRHHRHCGGHGSRARRHHAGCKSHHHHRKHHPHRVRRGAQGQGRVGR
jgi:hypothetical protein